MAIRATTTSLACNSEPEVVFIRCFNAVSATSPACNSEPEVVFIWRFDAVRATTDVESPDTILTSQYCMAVSIDTCFAIARFFGWFWRVNSQWVTPGFPKTWNTPGLSVRCVTYLCTLYTVPRQHWANAVPLDDGDILGPCSMTTHHSPMMRPSHGSSAAAFCDEVVCHVIVSASLHRVNASSWTRPGPLCSNPTFLALATCGNNERKQQTDQCRHQWRLRLFNSIMRARICTFVTSQRSTAVSIDTRIAAVRFSGQFWSPTCPRVGVP
jgi:hypothetical protein